MLISKGLIGLSTLGLSLSVAWYKKNELIGNVTEYCLRIHSIYARRFLPHQIILVRHGESEANVNEQIYAQVPDNQIKLTQKGLEQAQQIGKILYDQVIPQEDKIYFYYSPLLRSKQTCQNILNYFEPERYVREESFKMREQEWGNFVEFHNEKDVKTKVLEMRKQVGSFYFRFKNGESGADVGERVTLFLNNLIRKMNDVDEPWRYEKKSVVIVSHSLTIQLFLMKYFKLTVDEYYQLKGLSNCEAVVLKRKGIQDKYRIEAHYLPSQVMESKKQQPSLQIYYILLNQNCL